MANDLVPYSQAIGDPSSTAASIETTDVFALAREDVSKPTGYKSMATRFLTMAKETVSGIQYSSELTETTSKTITGAINEIAQSGGSVDITSSILTPATIQTFTDGGDNAPLNKCEVEIAPDAGGFSAVNVSVNGKNFYPIKVGFDLFADNRSANHTTTDEVLTINMDSQNNSGVYGGTGSAVNNSICQTIKKLSGSFVMSLYAKSSADNKDVYFGFQSFYSVVETLSTVWKRIEVPMTLDGTIHTLNFYNRSGSAISVDIKDVQIELGSDATTYDEFKGQTYTIPLNETLTQGGTLEVVSGLLTRTDTTTAQLTGMNVYTIAGINNIYSDVGDINEMEYFNDKSDDIESLIELETREDKTDYSTEERIVGKWYDGQTLYEKTLFFNNVKLDKTDATSELVHGVSNIGNVKFVYEAYNKFSNVNDDWSPVFNMFWNNSVYNFQWCVGNTSIWILSASGVYFDANPNRSYLIKIRYTKT